MHDTTDAPKRSLVPMPADKWIFAVRTRVRNAIDINLTHEHAHNFIRKEKKTSRCWT